ncbi:hypothetical protein GW17_00057698 [Ensete ventricosum]|nr:hypothetical protein GW17_00057698 [Ensete ventricosum]
MPPRGERLFLALALLLLVLVPGLDALRTLGDGNGADALDAAVELNASNFDSVLKESPLKFAVVEFFASWYGLRSSFLSETIPAVIGVLRVETIRYYILLPLFCSSFGLGDEKYENEDTLPRNASDPEEVCSSILILELIIRCRRGSAEMLVNFDDLWPSDPISLSSQETTILQQVDASKYYHICGKEVPHGYWVGILLYYSFWSMVVGSFPREKY